MSPDRLPEFTSITTSVANIEAIQEFAQTPGVTANIVRAGEIYVTQSRGIRARFDNLGEPKSIDPRPIQHLVPRDMVHVELFYDPSIDLQPFRDIVSPPQATH